MRNFGWTAVVGMVVAGAGLIAGCALFQPLALPDPTSVAHVTSPSPQAQVAATLAEATELLTELKSAANLPATTIAPATPVTLATPAPGPAVPQAAPVIPAINAPATAPASRPTLEKQAEVIALLTTAMQQLNTDMQNAPTTQARQQAAFDAGVQTAQSAAVTFGGPYGTLIAAGIGIISVLVQGLFNTGKAHQAAQAANATAQTLAGKLPPAGH